MLFRERRVSTNRRNILIGVRECEEGVRLMHFRLMHHPDGPGLTAFYPAPEALPAWKLVGHRVGALFRFRQKDRCGHRAIAGHESEPPAAAAWRDSVFRMGSLSRSGEQFAGILF